MVLCVSLWWPDFVSEKLDSMHKIVMCLFLPVVSFGCNFQYSDNIIWTLGSRMTSSCYDMYYWRRLLYICIRTQEKQKKALNSSLWQAKAKMYGGDVAYTHSQARI
jgi:hypothetical protein